MVNGFGESSPFMAELSRLVNYDNLLRSMNDRSTKFRMSSWRAGSHGPYFLENLHIFFLGDFPAIFDDTRGYPLGKLVGGLDHSCYFSIYLE